VETRQWDFIPERISTMTTQTIQNQYPNPYIDRYEMPPSSETLKRLHQEPDPGNQPADLEKAGLDFSQQMKAMEYAIAYKADLGRSYSHEFLKYLSELTYSVLRGWLQENTPEEIQDLFEAVIILSNDVSSFQGSTGFHDPHYALIAELVTEVSQLIPRLGGRFDELKEM
jgi:hypothetical protein